MKDSFIFYTEYKEAIECMTDAQAGMLLKALIEYSEGIMPSIKDASVKMVFLTIKPRMDRDREKWLETCEKRREAGKQGGRPAKAEKQEKAKKANGFSEKQKKQNKAIKADTDSDSDTDSELYINNTVKDRPKNLSAEFDELWKLYPRKQGRAQAMKSYFKARKEGTEIEKVRDGIIAYSEYVQRNGVGHEYIKQGSTFFNQHAWNDDWSYTAKKTKPPERSYNMDELELKLLATN